MGKYVKFSIYVMVLNFLTSCSGNSSKEVYLSCGNSEEAESESWIIKLDESKNEVTYKTEGEGRTTVKGFFAPETIDFNYMPPPSHFLHGAIQNGEVTISMHINRANLKVEGFSHIRQSNGVSEGFESEKIIELSCNVMEAHGNLI